MQIDKVLGIVGVLYVGEYDPEKHYEYLNCTTHNGSSYTCVNPDGVTGIEPGTTDDWQLSAKKGDVGPVGPKPVNGVDYNTPEEKEEFKNDVVNKATEEVKGNIAAVETEAIENYNDNATQKTEEYNSNATSKVSEYNTNASSQTKTFNNNATNKTNSFDENATSKTNDFNDNYDEKMQAINEASTSIEAERKISDSKYACALKMQVKDEQQTQIYAENDLVKNLKIKGAELTQVVTEQSENIILLEDYSTTNNHGIDVTVKDNKITLNGTATAAFNLQLPIKYKSKDIITGDTCIGYISSGEIVTGNGNVTIYGENSKSISLYIGGENPAYQKKVLDNFSIQNVNLYLAANTVLNNIVIDFTLANVTSLDAGIQFVPNSPSLDFPSEIQVVNEQKILICRKNLIKSIQYADNVYKYGWVLRIEAPLKSNTEYTIGLIGAKDNKYYLAEDLVKGGGTALTVTMTGTMQYITFTTKENISVSPTYVENEGGYILFKNIISQPNAHIFEDVMLIEGTVNEAYEAYEGQELSIPLRNLAINDYSDIIDRENEKQDKFIVELILDGTENWIASGSNDITNSFQLNLNYEVENYIGICNCLKTGVAGNVEKFSPLGTSLYIAINKTRASTVKEFKALIAQLYSSGNPLKFYLIRLSPITNPLSEEVKQELDKFKLYDNLNNIFIDNGSLSFIYNKSLLRAFKEQSELSASLLERVQALEAAQVNSVGGN